MPYFRTSRARNLYNCAECGAEIRRRELYFRDEPHPRARYFRGIQVRHLCSVCVLGEKDAARYQVKQLELPFESTSGGLLYVPPRVELIDITPQLVRKLARAPDLLAELDPDRFEDVVVDRLEAMGFEVKRVGASTYQRDGGIDAVAWPRSLPYPFLLAVQVKHTRSAKRKVGPEPVRQLFGVLKARGFQAGMVVTNTTFTPDARWFAEQTPMLMQLRDNKDLRRWLRDEFLREYEWRSIPRSIQVCRGFAVSLPP